MWLKYCTKCHCNTFNAFDPSQGAFGMATCVNYKFLEVFSGELYQASSRAPQCTGAGFSWHIHVVHHAYTRSFKWWKAQVIDRTLKPVTWKLEGLWKDKSYSIKWICGSRPVLGKKAPSSISLCRKCVSSELHCQLDAKCILAAKRNFSGADFWKWRQNLDV